MTIIRTQQSKVHADAMSPSAIADKADEQLDSSHNKLPAKPTALKFAAGGRRQSTGGGALVEIPDMADELKLSKLHVRRKGPCERLVDRHIIDPRCATIFLLGSVPAAPSSRSVSHPCVRAGTTICGWAAPCRRTTCWTT